MTAKMLYPLLSEYIDAILSSEDNLAQLNYLRPVLDKSGRPIMSSGNFAVVFKMKDDKGRQYAMKCFLRDQKWRADKYRLIASRLKDVCSPYFIEVTYYERELFVDSKNTEENEFPVLLMDWVDGLTLNEYLRQIIDSKIKLSYLAYSFGLMSSWLLEQDFAHGDIKPDNILVKKDGSLVLIDYDGMFVPDMGYIGYPHGDEIGSPGFRHPLRSSSDFSSRMDDFSLIVILLSLRIIANDPSLWVDDGSADKLVFSESDFLSPLGNSFISQVYSTADQETRRLFSLFLYALATKELKGIESKQLELSNPFKVIQKQYSSHGNRVVHVYGLEYSQDCKCLLSGKDVLDEEITIPSETLYIADDAFKNNTRIKKVFLPNGLLFVGGSAFSGCNNLTHVIISEGVTSIRNLAFYNCSGLTNITIPEGVTEIGESAFSGCSSLTSITIPESVTYIEKLAFSGCSSLTSITIPENVTEIGESAFQNCSSLTNIISEGRIPPTFINSHMDYYRNIVLYVPIGSLNAYQTTYPNLFKEIIEVD